MNDSNVSGNSKWACMLSVILTCALIANIVEAELERVSVDEIAAPFGNSQLGDSDHPALSTTGRYIAFDSQSTTFVSAGPNQVLPDTNVSDDVFVRDRQARSTKRMSVISGTTSGAGYEQHSKEPSISGDGRYVAFESQAPGLDPTVEDDNNLGDIFIHDRQTGITTRISNGIGGTEPDGWSSKASISRDGRYVAYESAAENLVDDDDNGYTDIFVYDRILGDTRRISEGPNGAQADWLSGRPSISGDGRYVAFESAAHNLTGEGDPNTNGDVFVWDRKTGLNRLVSIGNNGEFANGYCSNPKISANGRYVAFLAAETNLLPGDTYAGDEVLIHDLVGRTTRLVSQNDDGEKANYGCAEPGISDDGRYVVFRTEASNLVESDTDGRDDVFVRDIVAGKTALVSLNEIGSNIAGYVFRTAISGNGRKIAFQASSEGVLGGPGTYSRDLYLIDNPLAPPLSKKIHLGAGRRPSGIGSARQTVRITGKKSANFYLFAKNVDVDDELYAKTMSLQVNWIRRAPFRVSFIQQTGDGAGSNVTAAMKGLGRYFYNLFPEDTVRCVGRVKGKNRKSRLSLRFRMETDEQFPLRTSCAAKILTKEKRKRRR